MLYTALIVIGAAVYTYGNFATENSGFHIEGGKILLYVGIALFVIDRVIKLVKKK